MYKRNAQGWSKHLDFIILDEIVLQTALIIASLLRHGGLPYFVPLYRNLAFVLFLAEGFVVVLFNSMHDVLKRGIVDEVIATIKLCLLVFFFATAYMFSVQRGYDYSRIVVFFTFLFHTALGLITRVGWKAWLNKHGSLNRVKRSMLVVLDEKTADAMMARFDSHPVEGYIIVGIVLNSKTKTERKQIGTAQVVCTLEEAPDYICREWIDSVYIDCSTEDPRVLHLMDACKEMAVPTHYHVPGMSRQGMKQFVEKIGGTTVLTTSINYATPVQLLAKRLLDIVGGLIGSVMAILIMVIVGPIIQLQSPGPILYTQERIGSNGRRFKIVKIRSMHMNADAMKARLMEQNRVSDGMMFKLDWDPRIIGNRELPDGTRKTGIGEFIRKYSLDEFPQFFNVLKGDMSLVGTRPPTVDEWEKYEFHHRARLACKPGITGMWQVSGRSEITDFEEVVKLDTEYIVNWSFALDIKLLLKTVFVVLGHKGAM